MLTEHEWITLSTALKYWCKTHIVAFDWDEANGILWPTRSKFKPIISFICLWFAAGYFAFDIIRLPLTYHKGQLADFVMHIICCLWYSTVALLTYIVDFKCRDEFTAILNLQMKLNSKQGMIYTHSSYLNPKKRELLLRYLFPAPFSMVFIWTAITVVLRGKYYFVFSALPEELITWRILFCVTCGEFIFAMSYGILVMLILMVVYVYLASSSYWLNVVCVKWPKQQLEIHSLKQKKIAKLESSHQLYRNLELINKTFNHCFASLAIPELKLLCILAISVVTYALIKQRRHIHPLMEIMMLAISNFMLSIILFMCVLGAKFHNDTRKFHSNYKLFIIKLPMELHKYYKKFFVACPTFGFQVGRFYVIKKVNYLYTKMEILKSGKNSAYSTSYFFFGTTY